MSEAPQEEVLRTLERALGERIVRSPAREEGALATVSPMSAEEVELIAKTAARYSVPLVAQGAGTGPETGPAEGSILLRFDLMRGLRLPEGEEPWVEAGPGASWLELDDNLSVRGLGLAVYPTSAPRATIGGWLARDGLGVGSFEYGWLHENVLSADMVLPGGERLTVKGEELRSVVRPETGEGIVVGARLRTRSADDLPYALEFPHADEMVRAAEDVFGAGLPLWHLGLLSAEMAKARSLGDGHLLFGAYPRERSPEIEDPLRGVASSHSGRVLSPAEAYRAWGERFFPVAPSHPTPAVTDRLLVPLEGVGETLQKLSTRAVQGTVARSSEVLLLALDADEDGRTL